MSVDIRALELLFQQQTNVWAKVDLLMGVGFVSRLFFGTNHIGKGDLCGRDILHWDRNV